MNSYAEAIAQRGITRLCHFTKSSNLPFILGDGKFEKNGILSTAYIRESSNLEELDKQRLDGHVDYVSCSVQVPNEKYFYLRQQKANGDIFHQWAVIYIDPMIIDDTTYFSPVNAATAHGQNLSKGLVAFQHMFANPIQYRKAGSRLPKQEQRPAGLPANRTTDNQAEVMVKNRIPLNKIIGVAFPAETYEVERLRLRFCDIDTSHLKIERLEE